MLGVDFVEILGERDFTSSLGVLEWCVVVCCGLVVDTKYINVTF